MIPFDAYDESTKRSCKAYKIYYEDYNLGLSLFNAKFKTDSYLKNMIGNDSQILFEKINNLFTKDKELLLKKTLMLEASLNQFKFYRKEIDKSDQINKENLFHFLNLILSLNDIFEAELYL